MTQQQATASALRPAPLAAARLHEEMRRAHLKAVRAAVAEAGYAATITMPVMTGPLAGMRQKIRVEPQIGIRAAKFHAEVGDRRSPATRERLIEAALVLADLQAIAIRRNDAIRTAGGCVYGAPAWAFVGHPVARALAAAIGASATLHLTSRSRNALPRDMRLPATVHDLRVSHVGVLVKFGGNVVTMDAAGTLATIRMRGTFPASLVAALPGRPLHSIMALPGLEAGTPMGDAVIRTAHQGDAWMRFTVDCALVPLMDAPEGIDASFLQDWLQRHAC